MRPTSPVPRDNALPVSRKRRRAAPRALIASATSAAVLLASAGASAQANGAGKEPPVELAEPASPQKEEREEAPIDVSVEGARGTAPRGTRDPDVASYVVRGEAMKRPGATAVDVIAASPGVQAARTGAGSDLATVSIRGAPSAQLPVYLAGVRLNDDVTGGADLSTVPLFALDRVEIYRGNAPSDADRLGIGGAIFFEPRLPRGTRAGGSFGAGSFGELSFGAFGSTGDERAGALLSFSRQSATNDFTFRDNGGTPQPGDDAVRTRTNGDATTHDAWAIGRVALPGGGRIVLVSNAFAREQGLASAAFSPASEARSATRRELLAVSARMPCSNAATPDAGASGAATDACSIDVRASAISARRTITDPGPSPSEALLRASIAGDRWQQATSLRARIGDRLELRGSLFTGMDRLEVRAPGATVTRASRLSFTGSASAALNAARRVKLFAVAGGECHTTFGVATGDACAAGGPLGRAGVRIALPKGIEVVASGGSYVRVPSLGEMYGLSGTVLGNPALHPERGYTGEIEARWTSDGPGTARFCADVTGFARFVENLIVYRLTYPDTIKPFNVDAARVLGVEALAGIDVLRHVNAEVSLTLLDPRDASVGGRGVNELLPYHATATFASFLEVYTSLTRSVHFIDRVALAATFRFRSVRTAGPATFLDEQRDLGLAASARFLGGRIAARFSAQNLLDVTNQDLLGFALPGRSFYGGVEAIW